MATRLLEQDARAKKEEMQHLYSESGDEVGSFEKFLSCFFFLGLQKKPKLKKTQTFGHSVCWCVWNQCTLDRLFLMFIGIGFYFADVSMTVHVQESLDDTFPVNFLGDVVACQPQVWSR